MDTGVPAVQKGTPGIRLVSSYDLGLPGGARNDRVDLIQQEYYNAEQKRIVTVLKRVGFTDAEILDMRKGKVSKKWKVHHILPLDDSGTNDFSNLVLIVNDPYHKVLTNYQNDNTRCFEIGKPYLIEWPVIHDPIYYGKGGERHVERIY